MAGQIDEIKARVDIVDLISEYIRLKQMGSNWRALCPFHNEKSPSFMVSRDKQIWHCFGCGEGGDIFTFVQKIEGMDFPESLKVLAQKAGVKLVAEDPQLSSQRNRLSDVCALTANFWHHVLTELPQGKKAREYLDRRGVTKNTIDEFKLGYAVDTWDTLIKFLRSRKFTDQEIFLAGLSVRRERGTDFYDRFRDRLMFPINDLQGNPIGFSGRTLNPDEKGGKYINTPQTVLFNKSVAIFNIDKAKTDIKKKDLAILVEGQMDVIASYQAGVINVVASSGTALTLDQVKILKRYTSNIAIAFDADAAGQTAAKRGIDIALGQEMNIRVILIAGGKDPDECIKNNPADWTQAIDDAKTIMQYYFDDTLGKINIGTAEGKKQAAKILLTQIAKLPNKIEQTHWIQKLADALHVTEQVLKESLPAFQGEKIPVAKVAAPAAVKDRSMMLAEHALALALTHPSQISFLIDNLSPDMIGSGDLHDLYRSVIIYYTESINGRSDSFNYAEFRKKIGHDTLVALADQLVLRAEKDFFDFDDSAARAELTTAITAIKRNSYETQLKEIERQLKDAESVGQATVVRTLVAEANRIISQLTLLH